MRKKAQVLMIFLWTLVVLVILAISIAQRASMTFKYTRYHKDRLKATYLAKAAVNRTIVELNVPDGNWQDNPQVFKEITLGDNPEEFASVSYVSKENSQDEVVFGVVDEERKININTASEHLLTSLFEEFDMDTPEELSRNVLIWRGNLPDTNKVYESLGYLPKAEGFANIEELMLVKDITQEDYEKIKGLITVHSNGININTVSPLVLKIFIVGLAKELNVPEDLAQDITEKIIALRNSRNSYFRDKEEIDIPLIDNELTLFNELLNRIILSSDNFSIEVKGIAGKIEKRIKAIYSRKDKKVLSWHES